MAALRYVEPLNREKKRPSPGIRQFPILNSKPSSRYADTLVQSHGEEGSPCPPRRRPPGPEIRKHRFRCVDESKAHFPDFRHRALRHHTERIFLAERIFGVTVFNFRRTTDGMSVVLKLGFWRDSLWFGGSTFSIYG